MAKRSKKSAGGGAPPALFSKRRSASLKPRRWSLWAAICGILLAAYIAAAYVLWGPEQPALLQRLLGLGCVALTMLTFMLATRRPESAEELLMRTRMGQHADFGKLRRVQRPKRRTIRLPKIGEVGLRPAAATVLFVLVVVWWLTPLAPVRVKAMAIEDLTSPLKEEILAAVLVLPDGKMAILQPPIVPARVRQLARQIDEDKANAYSSGLKAIAEGRFGDARTLLATAKRNQDAQPLDILLAEAHSDMFAGRFGVAAAGYVEALKLSPEDPMLMCMAAIACMQKGQFDRAEPWVTRAVEVVKARSDENDPDLAVCLLTQGVLAAARATDYDRAEALCWESREIAEKAFGHQHRYVAASFNNQSMLYAVRAKNAGAEELSRGAQQIWSEILGPNDPRVATSLDNLAMIYYNQARYVKAAELLDAATTMRIETLSEEHSTLPLSLTARAALQRTLGKSAEARASAEKALAMAEKIIGPEYAGLVPVLDTLAGCYVDQALYAKAEAVYLRAVELAQETWGPKHPCLAVVLDNLAQLHIVQNRFDEAVALCEQALNITTEALGEKHPRMVVVLNTRGRLEIERGQPRDAGPYLRQAEDICDEVLEKGHIDVARTLGNLAVLDSSSRGYKQGVGRYDKAIEITKQCLGAEHREVARLLTGLAVLHAGQRAYDEAEPCLRRALAILDKAVEQKTLVAYHPELAEVLETYVKLLGAMTPPDADRAAVMAERAKSIRQQHDEVDQPE